MNSRIKGALCMAGIVAFSVLLGLYLIGLMMLQSRFGWWPYIIGVLIPVSGFAIYYGYKEGPHFFEDEDE